MWWWCRQFLVAGFFDVTNCWNVCRWGGFLQRWLSRPFCIVRGVQQRDELRGVHGSYKLYLLKPRSDSTNSMYHKTIKTLAFPNSPKNEFSGSHELKDFRSSPWRFLIRFLNSICFWPEWTRRYLHIPKGRLCVLWWGPAVWRQKLVLFRQQHLIVCSRSICTVQYSHTKSASCDDYRTMEQRVFSGGSTTYR